MRKLAIALVVALLCGAVAMVGTAGARGKAATKVTIKYNGDGFEGKVKSSKAKCVKNRTVKVQQREGNTYETLYKDTSDSEGQWDTGNTGETHGFFRAVAKRTTDCKKGVSKTIRV
jgi:hypothetical protein